MNLENSFDLLELKHNIKPENDLILLINEVLENSIAQVQEFLKKEQKLNLEKYPDDLYKERSLYEKIIKSKNWIITKFHQSKYAPILIRNIDQPQKIAEEIAWEWVKLEKKSISFYTETHLKNLKTELTEVLVNFLIARITDIGEYLSTDKFSFSQIPNSEMVELAHISELENEIDFQKKLNSIQEQRSEERIEKIQHDKNELKLEIEKLKDCERRLKDFKGRFFFHQDNLFQNYIIGDKLPELNRLYHFLKENNVYDSNWGYFAYCFSEAGLRENDQLKITFLLNGSDFSNNDIGYILYLIKKNYLHEHQFKFEKWFFENVEVITKQNKRISLNKDRLQRFIDENIRSYKGSTKTTQNFDLINQELQFLL